MTIPPKAVGVPEPSSRASEPSHATWSHGAGRLQALTVWTERRPGHGEDAEPLAIHHLPTGNGLLAVFDGSGGSGAAPAWSGPDGRTHTGAWVGARAARLGAERWFHRVVGTGQQDTADGLAEHLRDALRAAMPTTRSKLAGSMRRVLPTTMAAVRYRFEAEDGRNGKAAPRAVRWRALWAGDSRSYALLPQSGLHALTRDHTTEDDALVQLRQDPPMTNVLCADRSFTVAAHPAEDSGDVVLPCVLLSATDGFFGYVNTPAHFEWVLLETLMASRHIGEWAENLRRTVEGYTADDASLSLVALGFPEFSRLRESFYARYKSVRREYVGGMPPRDGQHDDALRRWEEETWRSYQPAYEKAMPPLPEVRE